MILTVWKLSISYFYMKKLIWNLKSKFFGFFFTSHYVFKSNKSVVTDRRPQMFIAEHSCYKANVTVKQFSQTLSMIYSDLN